MSLSDSFHVPDISAIDRDDDIDSLPSSSTESFESDDDFDAQKEWEASLEQLQLLLTMIIVPFAGKYFGRKFAYWSRSQSSSETASIGTPTSVALGGGRLFLYRLANHTISTQVGLGIWNGVTTWKYSGRTRRSFRLLVR